MTAAIVGLAVVDWLARTSSRSEAGIASAVRASGRVVKACMIAAAVVGLTIVDRQALTPKDMIAVVALTV